MWTDGAIHFDAPQLDIDHLALAEVRFSQISSGQVCSGQVAAAEVGFPHNRVVHGGAVKFADREIRLRQHGLAEIAVVKLAIAALRFGHISPKELGVAGHDIGQMGRGEIRFGKHGAVGAGGLEVRSDQLGLAKVGAPQIAIGQIRAAQILAAEIAARQAAAAQARTGQGLDLQQNFVGIAMSDLDHGDRFP